jgi:phage tail sheath protein FI
MAFQVSPGVQVKEIDLTNVVPAVSTSIGAIVGDFAAGPIEEIVTVSSEAELVSIFGQPTNDKYVEFFQAASFLKYGNALKVIRADIGQLNATADNSGLKIKNMTDYEDNFEDGSANVGAFAARAPGTIGNSIGVTVCPASSTEFASWTAAGYDFSSNFDTAPGTSEYVEARGGSNDEMHVVVYDVDGKITGTVGSILETFAYVSAATDAKKNDGSSNYYKNVINSGSSYIYWMDHDANVVDASNSNDSTHAFVTQDAVFYTFGGGFDGTTPTIGQLQQALDLFSDADTVDINLLIATVDETDATTVAASAAIAMAEARRDIVAFISPPMNSTVGNSNPTNAVKAYFDQLTSTSYAVSDSTAVKVYDKYNDVYRWIPANGHTAGLCAYTDSVSDAWFSPAGLNRGQLLGVVKLAYNPNRTQRDTLYKARINPVVSFPGEGTVLYGDKTMLARPSAFDRINVRRLFIVLEKAIATAAKFQLFELNDEFTRAQFRNMVEPFLRDIKGRRGVTDFLVVCDETNNTGQVIDTNNFVADIYIKPARSINFITLNFIATRTGVEFSEITGQ